MSLPARHRVRCYPSPAQICQLQIEFETSRVVYNLCVEMARHAHKHGEKYPGRKGFNRAITIWKRQTGWPAATQACNQCLQWAAIHADKAFQHFFRRVKQAKTPGYPQLKKAGQTTASASYNLVHCRWDAETGKLTLGKQKTPLKLNWDRRGIPAHAKTVTICRDAACRYFASFTCQKTVESLPATGRCVGVDMGVNHPVAFSDGHHHDLPPLPTRLSPGREKRLERLKRKLSRQERGSRSREKTKWAIARLEARQADARRCWQDATSRYLVDHYDLIAIEDLAVSNLTRAPRPVQDQVSGHYLPNKARAKARLNKAILNVGMGALRRQIEYKAAWAGRQVVAVNPAYTSQTCAVCGHVAGDNRHKERFLCVSCGHTDGADDNAAKNILQRALAEATPSAVGGDPAELRQVEGCCSDPVKPEFSLAGNTTGIGAILPVDFSP